MIHALGVLSVSDTLLTPLLGAFHASYPNVRVQVLVPNRYVDLECKWLDRSALDYDRAFQQEWGHSYCLVTAKGKCIGFQIDIQFRLSKCSYCDRCGDPQCRNSTRGGAPSGSGHLQAA